MRTSSPKPNPPPRARRSIRSAPLPLRPLLWLIRLFTRQLRLVRNGRRWRVVFADTAFARRLDAPSLAVAARPVAAAAVCAPTPSAVEAELHQLLGRHVEARQLMRHLAFIERTLRLSGPEALDGLPPEVLQKGVKQLESLVADWSTPGLAELRLRLLMAVDGQQQPASRFQSTASKRSDVDTTDRMQVSEATESVFEALKQQRAETAPAEPRETPPR
jgi:hypothetical protein